jgi:peptide/nickel transport system ATP-binding protein/oligopeptide transport system ATP-binding protein
MAILEVSRIKKYFPVLGGVFLRRIGWVHAVDDVSFCVEKGETFGLVGESGCGKTTLGRCIMGLYAPTEGSIKVRDQSLSNLTASQKKNLASFLQMIFQDPFESLDPRQTIQQILEEKYKIHRYDPAGLSKEIEQLVSRVGLSRDSLSRYPHEFSGGQRQRIGIARAVSMNPEIIICDEPVSALDVSVQSKILNLLLDLQQTLGLTYVFISHDLSVVRHMADRIGVMYLGQIVEMAEARDIYTHARHPYTKALLSAVPVPDPDADRQRTILTGEVPSVENPPSGCRFHTRCPHAAEICRQKKPALMPKGDDSGHVASCHFF